MTRRKRVRLTTPKGIAKFPYLNKPDTKFNADGEYKVSLLLDPAEAQDFLERLDQLADEAVEKAKNDLIEAGKKAQAKRVERGAPYRVEEDEEGNETGKVEVRFKMKAQVKTKDGRVLNLEPRLFDAMGQPIDADEVTIYGGSIIRVNFTPNPYYVASSKTAGVSLLMNAVQVIELASYGEDASAFGFEAEEGGFTAAQRGFDDTDDDDDEPPFDADDDVDEDDF